MSRGALYSAAPDTAMNMATRIGPRRQSRGRFSHYQHNISQNLIGFADKKAHWLISLENITAANIYLIGASHPLNYNK